MKDNYIVEWAPFRLAEGVDEATLIATSDAFQTGFLDKQEGFLKRDLVKTAKGQWADLVYWDSLESAERAMQNTANSAACIKYFEVVAMGLENEDPMGVLHLETVKSYSRQ